MARVKSKRGPPPPAVTVSEPVKRTVFDYDEYVGRFTAINSVEVRARVSGYLDKLHFKDGQLVKQGDLLFTIDKRPFQNTLDQARANLVQAQSNVAFTESDYTRGQQLVRDKTITDQTFEQRTQAFRNAKASVSNNEAAVRQAELDHGIYRTTRAREWSYRRSARVTRQPCYRRHRRQHDDAGHHRFDSIRSISNSPSMKLHICATSASPRMAQDIASRNGSVQIALKLIDENDFDHEGRMDFVDNVIDRSTGTIRGRAVFSNPNEVFTPGMFARVRVPGSPPYEALLVPDAAIGTEQARRYVMVIDAQDTARQRYVTLGQLTSDNLARYQGRYWARRSHRGQWPDAGAARREGAAGAAWAPSPRDRLRREVRRNRPNNGRRQTHAHFSLFSSIARFSRRSCRLFS